MKITGNVGPNLNGIDSAKNKSSDDVNSGLSKAVGENIESAGSAKVNLSESAQMMQKAKSIASDDSIDDAKVAKYQALIDSGQYSVSAEAVADRLVDEHLLIPQD